MSGWIRVHRGWRDCAAFDEEPVSQREAWLWLIEKAAWKPMRRLNGKGESVVLERGQIHVSDRSLASAWQWDKKKVRRFLERLAVNQMTDQSRDQSGTTLTIRNYEKYQTREDEKGPASGPDKDQSRTTHKEGKEDSVSNETGVPPIDPVKQIFDLGVALLVADGTTPAAARSLIGRWRKDYGDGLVLEALTEARLRAVSDPKAWITAWLAKRKAPSSDLYASIDRKYA